MPKNPDEVGAIWNTEQTNRLSLSINIDDLLTATGGATGQVKLVAFVNDRKTGKQPDYRIYISRTREEREARRAVPVLENELPELTDEDIPFSWALPFLVPFASAMALAHSILV